MKKCKILCTTLFLLLLFSNFFLNFAFAFAYFENASAYNLTSFVYARAENDGVMLYKKPSLDDEIYFEIPKSYFVMLITNFSSQFYKVQYRDVVGYVLKSSVSPVAETPTTPYLVGATFRVYSSDGLSMLSSPYPSKSPTVTKTVELYSEIDYYGRVFGEEMISSRGEEWFFGKYDGSFGYLYKGLCDNLSAIPLNTEVTTSSPDPFLQNDNDYLYNLVDLSPSMKAFLIVLVCAPSVLLIIFIFKPFRIEKTKNKGIKKTTKNKVIRQIENMQNEDL